MADADHMQRIAEDHLESLRAKYGRIKHVVYNDVDLVFRKPSRPECKQHAAKLQSDDATVKADADEQLAQILVVQVADKTEMRAVKEAFTDLLDEYPYLTKCAAVGRALSELTGVVQDSEVKTSGSALTGKGSPRASTPTG